MGQSSMDGNPIVQYLKEINWSYRWQKIKDNAFYILGFVVLISVPWLPDMPLIGSIYKDLQIIGVIPNDPSIALLLTQCIIVSIFVASWDLLSGYSGQISFGHAIFYGMGAYITIIAKTGFKGEFGMLEIDHNGFQNNNVSILGAEVNIGYLQAMMISALVVTLFAIFVGIITLRSKGPYFALITLVIPLIAQELVISEDLEEYTGGEGGKILTTTNRIVPGEGITYPELLELQFKVIIVIGILAIAAMYIIAKSRIGIVFQSIREDELAAASSGINVNFYKLVAIALSGFFASFAGSLSPHIFTSATPSLFDAEISFQAIIFSIIGGLGSITGAVVATFFLIPVLQLYVHDAFLESPTIDTLSLALLLMIILKWQPTGLIRASKRVRNAIIVAFIWTLSLVFYDATDDDKIHGQTTTGLRELSTPLNSVVGEFFKRIHWIQTPEDFLINTFGEDGIFGFNVAVLEGRLLIYFIIGLFIGYVGPDLLRKLRLAIWGVWPSLGKYEPPN